MSHRTLHDLPTPALLLDLDILERNAARMAGKVHGLGAVLRPHVKTHKCIEVGEVQRRHGAAGITVATIVEARDFAAHGFDDITWAFPVPVTRLDEVVELARRVTLRVTVDSVEATDAVIAAARRAGLRLHVWLEVDSGYHRSGVDPTSDAAVALARRIADSPHLRFDGILTHAGHSYAAMTDADRRAVARTEREVTVAFAERLRAAGIAVAGVSVGSTPTITATDSLAGVTEARPGNYIFHDFMQVAAGVCRPEDVAVSVLATVISRRPGLPHVIVDAGALAMSKDPGPADAARRRGLGPVMAGLAGSVVEPALTLTHASQEHGFVEGPAADLARLPVGTRLRIMPNHSCLTAAMFDAYEVVRGETILDRWTIHRGR
jgi:D-serine deaminase-like pyridoxal phosphate-dependent protein